MTPPIAPLALPSSHIIVCHDMDGPQLRCQHTCGSEEMCRHEGWKWSSILGHKLSHTKHPQCLVSSCTAHSILKCQDHPDRRGGLGGNTTKREGLQGEQIQTQDYLVLQAMVMLDPNTAVDSTLT